jgi:mannose-6-phosphate isomerase-like protein (cupin superfamily)
MAGYTKKNVAELNDSAAEFGIGDIQEAHFASKSLDAQETGCGHLRIKPGRRQAFGHSHVEAEEVYFVIAGSGRVRLDDDIVELAHYDFLRVAPEVKRRFEAGPEGLEYIVFGTRHEGDGELHPDFWAPEGS